MLLRVVLQRSGWFPTVSLKNEVFSNRQFITIFKPVLTAAESRYYEATTVIQSAFGKKRAASRAMGNRVDVFSFGFRDGGYPAELLLP